MPNYEQFLKKEVTMDYLKELEQQHTDIEYACLVQKKRQSSFAPSPNRVY
jgi:hypothetical protein